MVLLPPLLMCTRRSVQQRAHRSHPSLLARYSQSPGCSPAQVSVNKENLVPLNTYTYILFWKVGRIGEPAQTSTTSSLVESRFLFVWKHSHCVALADPELTQFVGQLWD